MRDKIEATSKAGRSTLSAFIAALLAFVLAFMAFEPIALRSAFADEGGAASAEEVQKDNAGLQTTEPSDAEDPGETIPPEELGADQGDPLGESVSENGIEPADDQGLESNDARAGPVESEEANAGAQDDPADDGAHKLARAEFASCTVTFYDNDASRKPSIIARQLVSAQVGQTASIDVSDIRATPPEGTQVFEGWLFKGSVESATITIDPREGNVALYPAFASGHWLRYLIAQGTEDAEAVDSQFVAANEHPPSQLPVPERVGYSFNGWFAAGQDGEGPLMGAQVSDAAGAVLDLQALEGLLSKGDVELQASWLGEPTTYRVASWLEYPNDEGHYFYSIDTIGDDEGEIAISGEMTDVSDFPAIDGFELSSYAQLPIAGNGSTIVNVYYNRLYYEVKFHNGRSADAEVIPSLTIYAKYGADIHDSWPKPSADGSGWPTAWYTSYDESSNVFVTGIGTMPLGGADYYLKDDEGKNYSTVYRVQNVDGSDNFTDYVAEPFTSELSPWTTEDDYMPIRGFMVNAASEADARAISANLVGDPLATHDGSFRVSAKAGERYDDAPLVTAPDGVERHTLYFYYLRCMYDITFIENGGPDVSDVEDIYYEQSLDGLAPDTYQVGQTHYISENGVTWEFAGWYDNDSFIGKPFDFSAGQMPYNDIILYAKWEPAKYLVTVDPAGGEFTDSEQSTFFWVSHGERVAYIGAERNYVEDNAGSFVYEHESDSADPDGFGDVGYVEAQESDTAQRYRYEPGAYSLYGWFHSGEESALDAVPFDFDKGIVEDTSIVAQWKAQGVFDIAYNPVMDIEGGIVSGDIDVMLDDGYADLSPTFIMNTPVKIEASDGDEYEFVGWQLVESFDDDAAVLDEDLYLEGDGFVVDSDLATNNTIHLQAVYENSAEPQEPSSPEGSDGSATSTTNSLVDSSALPSTGDEVYMIVVALAGLALVALGLALIAFAMKRSHDGEESSML